MADNVKYLNNDGLLFLLQQLYSAINAAKFSGNYNDLTDKPTIPTVTNDLTDTLKQHYDAAYTHSQSAHLTASATISSTSTNATAAGSKAVYDFVTAAIANLTGFHAEIVSTLPSTGKANTMYLVKKTASVNGNIYDEYLYINNAFELIGTTAVDLSEYLKSSDIQALTNAEITTIINNAKA